jgi:pyrroline-5-carboxylate reductase
MTVIGVVGTGNMGAALAKGWLGSAGRGVNLIVWDKIEAAATRLLTDGRIRMAADVTQLAAQADVIFVVVKPKDAAEAIAAFAPALRPEQTVVSAMAGVTLASLRAMVGPVPAVFRIMPNLGVALSVGAVAVAVEAGADPARVAGVLALLEPLGLAQELPEEMIDVTTAVSGSGPGFLALAIESLEDGAVAAGLARPLARSLVRQAALDAAGLLKDHSDSPEELQEHLAATDQLFLPGMGTLEAEGVRSAFRHAVEAAVERSRRSGGSHVSPR